MKPIQVIFDTNVFVAALRSQRGASFKLLSLVGASQRFRIALSVPLVLEYEDVAKRQRGDHGLADQDVDDILDYLCSVADKRQIHFLWRPFLKDARDDLVLELALEAGCDCIITFNERDFAGVEQRFGVRVLGPRAFLREIEER